MGNAMHDDEVRRISPTKLSHNTIRTSLEVGMAIYSKANDLLPNVFLGKASIAQDQFEKHNCEVIGPTTIDNANQANQDGDPSPMLHNVCMATKPRLIVDRSHLVCNNRKEVRRRFVATKHSIFFSMIAQIASAISHPELSH